VQPQTDQFLKLVDEFRPYLVDEWTDEELYRIILIAIPNSAKSLIMQDLDIITEELDRMKISPRYSDEIINIHEYVMKSAIPIIEKQYANEATASEFSGKKAVTNARGYILKKKKKPMNIFAKLK